MHSLRKPAITSFGSLSFHKSGPGARLACLRLWIRLNRASTARFWKGSATTSSPRHPCGNPPPNLDQKAVTGSINRARKATSMFIWLSNRRIQNYFGPLKKQSFGWIQELTEFAWIAKKRSNPPASKPCPGRASASTVRKSKARLDEILTRPEFMEGTGPPHRAKCARDPFWSLEGRWRRLTHFLT